MLDWFQRLMPHTQAFFPQFERHAATVTAAAEALRRMLEGGGAVSQHCRAVIEKEEEADAITREVLIGVRSTFITPFDRGDIKALITAMDDAIDEMQAAVAAIDLYEVTEFEPEMRDMAAMSEQAAILVQEAMPLLRKVGRDHAKLDEITERIVHLEEEADHLHDAGLKSLYQRHRDGNAMGYIVGREIFSHLEKVLDRFEDVANEISGIVIDHA